MPSSQPGIEDPHARGRHAGHFIAHETQAYCPRCPGQPVFLASELRQRVPLGARYGYDVMVAVGEAFFCTVAMEERFSVSWVKKTSTSRFERLIILAGDLLFIWHWPMSRAKRNSSSSWTHGAAISCIWMGLAKVTVLIS